MPGKQRWLSMSLVIATALPWSISLGVIGLWLIGGHNQGVFESKVVSISGGIAALCGAQVIFLVCIADRVFPKAHTYLSRVLEGGLGVIFLGSSCVLAGASIIEWGLF
ncbi:MAG: hypothetical protein JKX70_02165 [Phycisphaerales bacterium]|nr:hypothetical protein [Phycisphaerales bacterium]